MTRRTRPPDTQTPMPDAVVLGVHQVHVVAAAVRPLALEEQVRCRAPRCRDCRIGTRCSRPRCSCCSRPGTSRSPGLPPMKWLQSLPDGELLAYGRETFDEIPESSLRAATFAAAGAAAVAGGGHQPPVRVQFISRGNTSRPRPSCRRRPVRHRPLPPAGPLSARLRLRDLAGCGAASMGRRAGGCRRADAELRRRASCDRITTTRAPQGRSTSAEDQHRARSRRTRSSPTTGLPLAVTLDAPPSSSASIHRLAETDRQDGRPVDCSGPIRRTEPDDVRGAPLSERQLSATRPATTVVVREPASVTW